MAFNLKNIKDFPPILFITTVVSVTIGSIFNNPTCLSTDPDWRLFYFLNAFINKAIIEYKQFPLWCPYINGGYPFVGHPLNSSLSLFIFPNLIFGEIIGSRVNIFIMHLIGALGMYYLTKKILNFNNMGAIASSLSFSLSIYFVADLFGGDLEEINYFFMPVVLALFIRAHHNKIALWSASVLLSMILNCGALLFVTTMLLLFFYAVLEDIFSMPDKKMRRMPNLKLFGIILSLIILLGTVKIFSLVQLLMLYPRPKNPFAQPAFIEYVKILASTMPMITLLSFMTLALNMRKNLNYLIMLVLFGALLSGGILYQTLWRLPIFKSMDTNYYLGPIMFIFCITGGKLFSDFKEKKYKVIRGILLSLLILNLFSIAWVCHKLYSQAFYTPVDSIKKYDFFQQKSAPYFENFSIKGYLFPFVTFEKIQHYLEKSSFIIKNSIVPFLLSGELNNDRILFDIKKDPNEGKAISQGKSFFQVRSLNNLGHDHRTLRAIAYANMLQNIGTIDDDMVIKMPQNAVPKYFIGDHDEIVKNPSYQGEVYFQDNKANTADITHLAPNTIKVNVKIFEADKLIINQNYHSGWKANKGEIKSYEGLISIDLQQRGEYDVTLKFSPDYFWIGLFISGISFIGSLTHCLRKAVRNRA